MSGVVLVRDLTLEARANLFGPQDGTLGGSPARGASFDMFSARPVLAACSSATADDPEKQKKQSCASVGGSCVGLSPSSCPSGQWGDMSTHSCGAGAFGVGCCLP